MIEQILTFYMKVFKCILFIVSRLAVFLLFFPLVCLFISFQWYTLILAIWLTPIAIGLTCDAFKTISDNFWAWMEFDGWSL